MISSRIVLRVWPLHLTSSPLVELHHIPIVLDRGSKSVDLLQT